MLRDREAHIVGELDELIQTMIRYVRVGYRRVHNGTRQNAERSGSAGRHAMVSFNHVIDPHFVTFCSSLYTTIRNPNPDANPNPNPNPNNHKKNNL